MFAGGAKGKHGILKCLRNSEQTGACLYYIQKTCCVTVITPPTHTAPPHALIKNANALIKKSYIDMISRKTS